MLIGLSGKKGSGKDTAYRFIREWGEANNLTVRRDAFADRLKLSAARIFFPDIGLEEAISWCNNMKEYGQLTFTMNWPDSAIPYTISGREFLQHYGTECHRDVFYSDFWLNPVALAYQDLPDEQLTVVTDVRFDNEAELIHEFEGEVWEIARFTEASDSHASEKPLSRHLVDYVIPNHGDLEDLKDELQLLIGAYV